MPKTNARPLTRAAIGRLRYSPNGPRIQRLWDATVRGLGVEVFASGRRSWLLRYTVHGRQRIVTLAPEADLDLDDARALAIDWKAKAKAGIDPKAQRDEPRPEERTVADLHREYTAGRYFQTRSDDFQHNFNSSMRRYVLPAIGDIPLAAVQRADVRSVIDELTDAGKEGAAQGCLTHLRVLFNFALDRELIPHSPADRIKVMRTTPGRRDQWLQTAEELRAAWFLDSPIQVRAMVRWCLLTGCRRDEARLATWDQITDDPGTGTVWTVPTTKNTRPLVLPVTAAMHAVLDEMAATFPGRSSVFPGTVTPSRPIPRGTSDHAIKTRNGGAWSWHVLRHTVESHLAELGISAEVRDLILNHQGRGGVGERYRHGRQLDTKRAALERWHRHLLELVQPRASSK